MGVSCFYAALNPNTILYDQYLVSHARDARRNECGS